MHAPGHRTDSVVTPGNHDGVHRGHRALVDRARALAERAPVRLEVKALTFDPHPTQFVAPHRAPPLLTTPARRAELLEEAGVDAVVIQTFDRDFASLGPEEFVEQVLVQQLGAGAVVVGPDYRFGARRAGDVSLLAELGAPFGLEVEVVPPVMLDDKAVSSSRVRRQLAQGDVCQAARMLTRLHEVTRRVVTGHQRGRHLGFPTANLETDGLLVPKDGVYAVVARCMDEPRDALFHGVANLGIRPTLQAGRSVEVHLFDFDGDLYGRDLRVGFVERLREERKFEGLEALRSQIDQDVLQARQVLTGLDMALARCF